MKNICLTVIMLCALGRVVFAGSYVSEKENVYAMHSKLITIRSKNLIDYNELSEILSRKFNLSESQLESRTYCQRSVKMYHPWSNQNVPP